MSYWLEVVFFCRSDGSHKPYTFGSVKKFIQRSKFLIVYVVLSFFHRKKKVLRCSFVLTQL